jgi:hypothetical protein
MDLQKMISMMIDETRTYLRTISARERIVSLKRRSHNAQCRIINVAVFLTCFEAQQEAASSSASVLALGNPPPR